MNFPDLLASGEAETRCFIAALKAIFNGEAWDDIAPYAERAWRDCSMIQDWNQVEARIRSEWLELVT